MAVTPENVNSLIGNMTSLLAETETELDAQNQNLNSSADKRAVLAVLIPNAKELLRELESIKSRMSIIANTHAVMARDLRFNKE